MFRTSASTLDHRGAMGVLSVSGRAARTGVVLVAALVCLLTAVHVGFIATRFFTSSPSPTFSFEGKDHPERWDIPELPLVRMQLEETTHYQTDGDMAKQEWDSIFPQHHDGFIFLGPNKRPFGLSMFHQASCFLAPPIFRQGIKPTKHIQHCFNYIRQMILCRSDIRLEPIDPTHGAKAVDAAQLHTCRDWSRVYELLEG
ncbi:hypothetical protein EXIGLDRAFT_778581 [Exidia glandulosa HHB12029]|uniref:Oxidase ustYa n=1 Tax=Exidia glandulosa HHB12029 TaxID=1314781 RepID=A0A165CGZ5_EXIGL|nr:hypothetical protein EXIGLDRAFT_778581 [Exidia glandulosa HHB12029]